MYVRFNNLKPSQMYRKELDRAYSRVMDSGSYVLGQEVKAFEEEFADYIGVKHCIGVGNGFDALVTSMMAIRLNPRKDVLVPYNAPLPTWMAITQARSNPVGIEPDPNKMVIDNIPRDNITISTGAVIPVHLYGIPVDIPKIREKFPYLYIIEDCAQAHGATINGKRVGSMGDLGCWSFYPTKNLGCFGDGGAITTDNDDLAILCLEIRSYGYERRRGINSRLDELQAAFLRVKLKYLDHEINRRRDLAQIYYEGLADLEKENIIILPPFDGCVFHQFVIRANYRNKLKKYLENNNIETMIHYPTPPYRMEYYGYGYSTCAPIADKLADTVLSLPIASVVEKEVYYVCEKIKEFYRL